MHIAIGLVMSAIGCLKIYGNVREGKLIMPWTLLAVAGMWVIYLGGR